MAQAFISYSVADENIAQWLYRSCENFGIKTFLASISLKKGEKWKGKILQELKFSEWFFFLATPNSIQSDAVKHEIGGALVLNKKIVPILYGIDFSDVPEWISDYQGIRVFNDNIDELKNTLEKIAEENKANKIIAALIIGAIIGALLKA